MSKEEKIIGKRRNTPVKKRSQSCYNGKVEKIKKWYAKLETGREGKTATKELKPIEWYIDKVKRPYGDK